MGQLVRGISKRSGASVGMKGMDAGLRRASSWATLASAGLTRPWPAASLAASTPADTQYKSREPLEAAFRLLRVQPKQCSARQALLPSPKHPACQHRTLK